MTSLRIEITATPSKSKGWGRYRLTAADGRPAIRSRTGNEWLYSDQEVELPDGWRGTLTVQAMNRVGAAKREEIETEECDVEVADGESFGFEAGGAQVLRVRVTGAR